MFSFRNDPDADGVGIAFFDAVAPNGDRLDLTITPGGRSADWDLVEASLGVPAFNVYQVHGARVLRVDADSDVTAMAGEPADALVTRDARLGLAVRSADCLPVLFADPDARVAGAAHAGRVGLAAGVLLATVDHLRSLGARRLRAWIGPHICGACYEVPLDLRHDFAQLFPRAWSQTSWGTPSLDLGAAAEQQLIEAGCVVMRVDPCTRTEARLHSHRRDPVAAGRQAGVIWLP